MNIDIYTDIICPWCYLGKRRLELALESAPPGDIQVRYLPFELSPQTPAAGVDRLEYLRAKYGEGIPRNDANLTALGREVGLEFDFTKATRIPNTHDAHRLVWLAGKGDLGVQRTVVEALHRAYFTDGKNLGDRKVLGEIGAAAGMNAADVTALLTTDAGSEQVRALEDEANSLGISGVPFFVFNRETAISGAQSVETFVSALQELAG